MAAVAAGAAATESAVKGGPAAEKVEAGRNGEHNAAAAARHELAPASPAAANASGGFPACGAAANASGEAEAEGVVEQKGRPQSAGNAAAAAAAPCAAAAPAAGAKPAAQESAASPMDSEPHVVQQQQDAGDSALAETQAPAGAALLPLPRPVRSKFNAPPRSMQFSPPRSASRPFPFLFLVLFCKLR